MTSMDLGNGPLHICYQTQIRQTTWQCGHTLTGGNMPTHLWFESTPTRIFRVVFWKPQMEDEHISRVLKELFNSERERFRSLLYGDKKAGWYRRRRTKFFIHDGLLCHTFMDNGEHLAQLVIPKSMLDEMLMCSHGDCRSGHPGAQWTNSWLERFCIWPGMAKNIEDKVKSCYECQEAYWPRYPKEITIIPQKAQYPLHFITVDLLIQWEWSCFGRRGLLYTILCLLCYEGCRGGHYG